MRFLKLLMAASVIAVCCAHAPLAKTIEERLAGKRSVHYDVAFNGLKSGYVVWEYLGTEEVEGVLTEALSVSSDTKYLGFFDMTSSERVYLDSVSYLPRRVERDLIVFGKKELISERYDQQEGQVTISRSGDVSGTQILRQDVPIHNILALLYFFPDNIAFKSGEWLYFNLPTQKVRIKMVGERMLKISGQEQKTYFLLGRGGKRFSIWLDKESRLPLRIEFIFPIGKVVITRTEPQDNP